MKIALIHYSAPPIVGGVENVMAEQARLMAADGHQVRILAGRGEQIDESIDFHCIPALDSRHVEVQRLKGELDRGRVPEGFAELAAEIERELKPALAGVDVLIAHNVCSLHLNLALTDALHALTGAPGSPRLIIWHHDLAWTTPRYRHELHAGYPWELVARRWPWAQQVVVSELRREELGALYGMPESEIAVVPNGVDPARFFKLEAQTAEMAARLDLLSAAPLFLLPVRLTPRKNIELALYILKELVAALPEATLVVTGPLGPHNRANVDYFDRLKALRRELELEGRAHFLAEHSPAFLPDAVIYDFFRLADALLMPSREEGFGIPILEAALEGIPIFCADIPPLRSLAGEHGVYFSPDGQPGEIAATIAVRLSQDPLYQLRARVRSRFTWDQIYRRQIAPLLEPEGDRIEPS